MRLLCATDLSSRSDRALRRAAAIARERDAELILLAVVDDDQPPILVEKLQREVAGLLAERSRAMHEFRDLAPQLRVEAGDAFDAIIRIAEVEAADLIVMGEHRRRLLRDIFAGTTVERVMRRGGRPVLMVNRPPERPYRNVVAAVDMSPASAGALRAAARLGLLASGGLTIFHAFQHAGKGNLVLADVPTPAVEAYVAATAAEVRQQVETFVGGLDLGPGLRRPRIVLEEGAPAEVLRRAMDRLSPDLVVIGTRNAGALKRFVLGSVAEEALRTLECDVLAVPADQT